jgi:hypothetical protein
LGSKSSSPVLLGFTHSLSTPSVPSSKDLVERDPITSTPTDEASARSIAAGKSRTVA